MNKRAYLVLGPESSGTRLMTKLLISAGCWGDDGHEQRLDGMNREALVRLGPPLIVWRRSVPHAGEWPNVAGLVSGLRDCGYSVTALVMSRDWHATACSQLAAPHAETVAEALANIQRAYRDIFAGLDGVPYEVVNYEALVLHGRPVLRYLMRRLGLDEPCGVTVYDGNAKWYPEEAEMKGATT